jgi:hypothetical protein
MKTNWIKRRTDRSLLSWRRACELQGVALKYPTRSSSGVRFDDGAIVFAIRAAEVLLNEHGCTVLLGAPDASEARRGCDEAAAHERLKNCRVAAKRGRAVGLLVYGEHPAVYADAPFELRVEKIGTEYWAYWGSARRWLESREFDSASLRLVESRVAALAAGH